ncbi:MAG: GNAT family N-acetyltransferase, partial [Candidatus Gastranaerophilales bacterium]|nr:GNAT family N-acetyltransferase [Candidatus Gastranaerophilales bacterium]
MQIQSIQTQNTFTSRNKPIPTEIFTSALGKITMREATSNDILPVAKLIRKNQAQSYKMSYFYGPGAAEAKEEYRQLNKNQWLKDIKEYLINLLSRPDGNSSLLVAVNENEKVIGYATMSQLEKTKGNIGIIEDIYLDYNYRKSNLGLYMLHKITDSVYGFFSKVVTKNKPICDISAGNQSPFRAYGFQQIPNSSKDVELLNAAYPP